MRIEANEGPGGVLGKVFVVLACAGGAALVLALYLAIVDGLWLVAILPAGVAALCAAWLWLARESWMATRRHGPMTLELDSAPTVGGRLAGRIAFAQSAHAPQVVALALQCVRVNDDGVRGVLRRLEQQVIVQRGPQGAFVPVEFEIPADLPDSSVRYPQPGSSAGDERAKWMLVLAADGGPDPVRRSYDVAIAAS